MAAHSGHIKSFGFTKGYGFIISEEFPDQEVFFSKRHLPQEVNNALNGGGGGLQLAGKPVNFTVETNQQGKPQANNIQFVASEGDNMVGTVKSYNSAKAFGFLQCESVPGQDIFFSKREVNPMFQEVNLAGMSATFLLSYAPDGKPQAKMVAPTGGGGGMAWGKGGCKGANGNKGGCLAPVAMWNPMMALNACAKGMGGWGKGGGNGWCKGGNSWSKGSMGWMGGGMVRDKAMTGIVKSYSDQKGFGFIQSQGVPTDIYFKGNGQSFFSGQPVSFFLNHTPDGKAQARSVSVGFSEGDVVIGSVKSYNASKGFGFIEVPDKPGDIYFKKELVPTDMQEEQIIGRQVQVMVHMSPDGKPQASGLDFSESGALDGSNGTVSHEPSGTKRAMGNWNNSQPKRMKEEPSVQMMMQGGECEGMVKSYNPMKGWGFIRTDMLPQDVYFKGNFPQAQPGTPCRFRLNYTPDGKPQAQGVEM